MGGGKVKAKALSKGNVINHLISEASNVEIESGASLRYNIENYLTADYFKDDAYVSTKTIYIPASDLLACASSSAWTHDNAWSIPAAKPISGQTGSLIHAFKDKNLHNGKFNRFTIYYYTNNASASLDIEAYLFTQADNTSPIAPKYTATHTLATSNTARVVSQTAIIDAAFTKDDLITVMLKITNASTEMIQIVGVELDYVTTEPSGTGMGTFDHNAL